MLLLIIFFFVFLPPKKWNARKANTLSVSKIIYIETLLNTKKNEDNAFRLPETEKKLNRVRKGNRKLKEINIKKNLLG